MPCLPRVPGGGADGGQLAASRGPGVVAGHEQHRAGAHCHHATGRAGKGSFPARQQHVRQSVF